MKILLRNIFVFALLLISKCVLADSEFSKDVPVKVTLGAKVQEQLDAMMPAERSVAETAIRVGGEFIQQYFDGSAYDTAPENENWFKYTAPIIAMDMNTWADANHFVSKEIKEGNSIAYGGRVTCPQVLLTAFQHTRDHTVLSYSANSLGLLSTSIGILTNPDRLYAEGRGDVYVVRVELNQVGRVLKVTAQDNIDTGVYTASIYFMQKFINNQRLIGFDDAQKVVRARAVRYKKLIDDMEQQAKQICN